NYDKSYAVRTASHDKQILDQHQSRTPTPGELNSSASVPPQDMQDQVFPRSREQLHIASTVVLIYGVATPTRFLSGPLLMVYKTKRRCQVSTVLPEKQFLMLDIISKKSLKIIVVRSTRVELAISYQYKQIMSVLVVLFKDDTVHALIFDHLCKETSKQTSISKVVHLINIQLSLYNTKKLKGT
ncbi:hypothetical protein L9F63_009849, partial [Diploptera punctata]